MKTITLNQLHMLCLLHGVSYFEVTSNAPFTSSYTLPISYVNQFFKHPITRSQLK